MHKCPHLPSTAVTAHNEPPITLYAYLRHASVYASHHLRPSLSLLSRRLPAHEPLQGSQPPLPHTSPNTHDSHSPTRHQQSLTASKQTHNEPTPPHNVPTINPNTTHQPNPTPKPMAYKTTHPRSPLAIPSKHKVCRSVANHPTTTSKRQ